MRKIVYTLPEIYCDVSGSPCLSKKRVKCTVRFFLKLLSLTPCLILLSSIPQPCRRETLGPHNRVNIKILHQTKIHRTRIGNWWSWQKRCSRNISVMGRNWFKSNSYVHTRYLFWLWQSWSNFKLQVCTFLVKSEKMFDRFLGFS